MRVKEAKKRGSRVEAKPDAKATRIRRMGRPPSKSAGEIEEAILSAAKELFLSLGYEATSMEAVAQAAGVSKRTLYIRHSTKEALIKAVVEDRIQSWSKEASARNSEAPEAFPDSLKRHAQTFVHMLANPEVRQFDRLILTTAHRFPEIAETFYEVGYNYELGFLTNEIIRGTQDDVVPPKEPRRVALQLLSMIQGWRRTEETVRTISAEEAAEFASQAVDVLLRGRDSW
jgi:TetR/AcrR family transcriptional regulator, mexJK operon transcriptional repressor